MPFYEVLILFLWCTRIDFHVWLFQNALFITFYIIAAHLFQVCLKHLLKPLLLNYKMCSDWLADPVRCDWWTT